MNVVAYLPHLADIMDSADELKAKEFELKRIETVGKFIDAATERQFKLASFSLAGNVGAIGASSLAIKDFKPKLDDKNHDFSDAMFWFLTGAIVSTVSLGFVLVASEVFSYLVGRADRPEKMPTRKYSARSRRRTYRVLDC
jgi:hypothetical protein